jgi:hypothetical protein
MKSKYNVDIVVDTNYPNVYMIYYPTYKDSKDFQEKRVEGFDAVERFCNDIKRAYD